VDKPQPGLLARLRAAWAAPKPARTVTRQYAAARPSRLNHGWSVMNDSADTELATSLTALRARSRQLVRDASYAKRAHGIIVNNVIGQGVGLQAGVLTSRGAYNNRINDDIQTQFARWASAENCHTGGALHFHDLERAVMGQVFDAGESIVRIHLSAFGDSKIPVALELIEAERMADEAFQPGDSVGTTGQVRFGIEQDTFGRPIAYWLRRRHPGDLRAAFARSGVDMYERVPAAQIIHLYVIDRWPQSRGEPWLHTAARRLNDMDGYSEAEIVAARGAANYFATIETPDPDGSIGEEQEDGTQQYAMEPGAIERLGPGEKLNFVSPNRPNAAMDGFMRYMLREVAAGTGISYESLSRDYSQSNYSSSRMGVIDDRDLFRVHQAWYIRAFRLPIHKVWLQQAIYAGALKTISVSDYALAPEKYEDALFKPRGWTWVDPVKEIRAYEDAVKAGFTTVSAVVAATGSGQDLEDVLNERRRELDAMEKLELCFTTSPDVFIPAATKGSVAGDPDAPQMIAPPTLGGTPGVPGAPGAVPPDTDIEPVKVGTDGAPLNPDDEPPVDPDQEQVPSRALRPWLRLLSKFNRKKI
jgi:lambda family phage portal protein